MSGWENIPKEEEAPPPPPRKPRAVTSAETDVASVDTSLDDGDVSRLVDEYWPHAWLMMTIAVSIIGIWAAVGKIADHPSFWP